MIGFLEKYVMPVAGKVAEQRHLQAIRDGIILTMPFLIIGSFFLLLVLYQYQGIMILWPACLGRVGKKLWGTQ